MTVERLERKPETNHEVGKNLLASFLNEPVVTSFFQVQPESMTLKVWERTQKIIGRYKDQGRDIDSVCKEIASETNVDSQTAYKGLKNAIFLAQSQSPLEIKENYPLELLLGALKKRPSVGLAGSYELARELVREDLNKPELKELMSRVSVGFLEKNKVMFVLIPSLIKQLNKSGEFDFPPSTEVEPFVEILEKEGVVVGKIEYEKKGDKNGKKKTVYFILKTDMNAVMDILLDSEEVQSFQEIIWKRRY